MNLEEAIKHAEEIAEENSKSYEEWLACKNRGNVGWSKSDIESVDKTIEQCQKCAEEHRQLAEWLKDYKCLLEQDTWILCRDKMPEEREWIGTKRFGTKKSDEVYVTFETPEGERFTEHLSFQNHKLSKYDQTHIDAICKGSVPIAWKPFSDPYSEAYSE